MNTQLEILDIIIPEGVPLAGTPEVFSWKVIIYQKLEVSMAL